MNANIDEQWLRSLEADLKSGAALGEILARILDRIDCVAGTVHLLSGDSGVLELKAAHRIPDEVLAHVREVSIGKGMAGIAAERRTPVQVCNLQTDASGVVRPGAKRTGMEGAIAVPMFAGEKLVGVLGVAKPTAYEFTPDEQILLLEIGRILAAATEGRLAF